MSGAIVKRGQHRCQPGRRDQIAAVPSPAFAMFGDVWECDQCGARWHYTGAVYGTPWRRTIPDVLGGRLIRNRRNRT